MFFLVVEQQIAWFCCVVTSVGRRHWLPRQEKRATRDPSFSAASRATEGVCWKVIGSEVMDFEHLVERGLRFLCEAVQHQSKNLFFKRRLERDLHSRFFTAVSKWKASREWTKLEHTGALILCLKCFPLTLRRGTENVQPSVHQPRGLQPYGN